MRQGTGIGWCSWVPRRMNVALLAAIVGLGSAVPVGAAVCVLPDNGGGTIDLPPNCLEGYVSLSPLHITQGLPPGSEILVDMVLGQFFVSSQGVGGGLGGEYQIHTEIMQLQLTGTGGLSGFSSSITMPGQGETHNAPRFPGDVVQDFATDWHTLQGQIIGDPDFDLLRITAGTGLGMPSPGHTTLSLFPGNTWNVDSFFDITYDIEFAGKPGGPLGGMSGSTTGTIRIKAGDPPTAFCPLPPPPVVPYCQQLQGTDCAAGASGDTCLPKVVQIVPGAVQVTQCDCFPQGACGAVEISGGAVSCSGFCPVPPSGNLCQVNINGVPSGANTMPLSAIPAGSFVTCACDPVLADCTPRSDGSGCEPVTCPDPGEECQPKCMQFNTATGQFNVVECECRGFGDCHVENIPGTTELHCVNSCLTTGEVCTETRTVDPATGIVEVCCDCVPEEPQYCPLPPAPAVPWCDQRQQTDCHANGISGETCLPRVVQIVAGGVAVERCDCYVDGGCGPIEITSDSVSCSGFCPVPPQGNLCQVNIDGIPTGATSVLLGGIPVGSFVSCGCEPTFADCVPLADGSGCQQVNCPNPDEECRPQCVEYNPATGAFTVVECACRGTDECRVERIPGTTELKCVGPCPPDDVCTETRTVDAAGVVRVCCDCQPLTPDFCPLQEPAAIDLCTKLQPRDCVSTDPANEVCLPWVVQVQHGLAVVMECDCTKFDQNCGPVQVVGDNLYCMGPCPPPYLTGDCQIFVDGKPLGRPSAVTTDPDIPDGATITCNCAPFPPRGACCYDSDADGVDETCAILTQTACVNAGGVYHGDNTLCGQIGACCYDADADGVHESCDVMDSTCCDDLRGTFNGAGSVCLGDANGNGIDDSCDCGIPPHVIILRSGNGLIGGLDSAITALTAPGGPPLSATTFTSQDFANACAMPQANVVAPFFPWFPSLTTDTSAQWIAGDPNLAPQSALYCYEFDVCCDDIVGATLTFAFAVDDGLGDGLGGPNTIGVYVNQAPVAGFAGGNFWTETVLGPASITLVPGLNTLHVYQRDTARVVSGIIFSAKIELQCRVEACCLPDGTCQDLDACCCRDIGGTPQGAGTSCAAVQCGQSGCVPTDDGKACTSVTCPSPNQKCRPRCIDFDPATGAWIVADCECKGGQECYAAMPAGVPEPECFGFCLPGEICNRTETTDPLTGRITVCCDCELFTPNLCPLPQPPALDPCAQLWTTDCVTDSVMFEQCLPWVVKKVNGLPVAARCDCTGTDDHCGPVQIDAATEPAFIACPNHCPLPFEPGDCQIFVNGKSIGRSVANISDSDIPEGSTITCDCAPRPPRGACCYDADLDGFSEVCAIMTATDCSGIIGGVYHGDGTLCGQIGACCYDADGDGVHEACDVMDSTCCAGVNGNFQGTGSICLGDDDGNGIDDTCDCDSGLQVITLRSGNGVVGGLDSAITRLTGPGGIPVVPNVFTPQDFANACALPPANVVAPYLPWWLPALTFDPLAKWISSNPARSPNSSLYCYEFEVCCPSQHVISASFTFAFAVDDGLGDQSSGPNPIGVYINGMPVPGFSGGNFASQTVYGPVSIPVMPGLNRLHVYQRDTAYVVSGIVFSARIEIACRPDLCCFADGSCRDDLDPCCCRAMGGTPGCPVGDPVDVPTGQVGFSKNRYISFVPGNPGVQTALRVKLADLPPPFEGDEGCTLWAGPPTDVSEVAGKGDATPPTFKLSRLQTSPHCMDWSTEGVVHVSDDEIVPSARYEVQVIDCRCDTADEAGYSAPLSISTSKWGDMVGGNNALPPNGVVDFNDISAVVDKFKNASAAPSKARADLAPDVPDKIVDFVDIPSVVDAFRGRPYPYDGPNACP